MANKFNGTINRKASKKDLLFFGFNGRLAWIAQQLWANESECIDYMYRVYGVDAAKEPIRFQWQLEKILRAVA